MILAKCIEGVTDGQGYMWEGVEGIKVKLSDDCLKSSGLSGDL